MAGLVVVVAAIAVALGPQLLASTAPTAQSSSPATSPVVSLREPPPVGHGDGDVPDGPMVAGRRGALGEADGAVPDGTTVFDDGVPGIANLDPDLLQALRNAATDAAGSGIVLYVNSGWRSPEYQDRLLREAVFAYGSAEEAARWVGTAETSAHVSGDAVDLGQADATDWLSAHGFAYGLCQIYANEPWHFERRPEASDHGCPPTYADPTQDPRMQQ